MTAGGHIYDNFQESLKSRIKESPPWFCQRSVSFPNFCIAVVTVMEGIQGIPQELILPFLFRAKIASILGLLPFSINLKTCRIERSNDFRRLVSYFHLFCATLRMVTLGTQAMEILFLGGNQLTKFSLSLTTFSFSVLATTAHTEFCHIKINDFITLFNSLKFQRVTNFKVSRTNLHRNIKSPLRRVFKWRYLLGNFKKVVQEFRKLGITGLVLFAEPIGGWFFIGTQFLNSIQNPGTLNTQVFGYLPAKWQTSSAVVICAIYDAFMNLFLISNIALMVGIMLTVRIAYFEPVERLLRQ